VSYAYIRGGARRRRPARRRLVLARTYEARTRTFDSRPGRWAGAVQEGDPPLYGRSPPILKRFAVSALAAVTLGLAVPASATAAEVATIYPITKDVRFFGSNDGRVLVDYSCSEPTTAADAISVRLVQPNGGTFIGGAQVTCDGTRQSAEVFVNGPQYVSKGPGHVLVTLQGTQFEQDVNVLPATSDEPRPPLVTASVQVIGKIVFTSATQGSITVEYVCNDYASGIYVVVTGRHGERATGGDGLACVGQDTDTVALVAEGEGFRIGSQKVTVQATLTNEVPLKSSREKLVRHKR